MPYVISGTIIEDSVSAYMARVRGANGQYVTRASVASIQALIYRRGAPPTPPFRGELGERTLVKTVDVNVAATIYDALQTSDPRWAPTDEATGEPDTVGYNFLAVLPGDCFPPAAASVYAKWTGEELPRQYYEVDFVLTDLAGHRFRIVVKPLEVLVA